MHQDEVCCPKADCTQDHPVKNMKMIGRSPREYAQTKQYAGSRCGCERKSRCSSTHLKTASLGLGRARLRAHARKMTNLLAAKKQKPPRAQNLRQIGQDLSCTRSQKMRTLIRKALAFYLEATFCGRNTVVFPTESASCGPFEQGCS